MNFDSFLIAASKHHEFDWVKFPSIVPNSERGSLLQKIPSKLSTDLQMVQVVCAGRTLWVAVKTERTLDDNGSPMLDEAGRLLRYSYGIVSDEYLKEETAIEIVSKYMPDLNSKLKNFLNININHDSRPITPHPAAVWKFNSWIAVSGTFGLIALFALLQDSNLHQELASLREDKDKAETDFKELKVKLADKEEELQKARMSTGCEVGPIWDR